MADEKKTATKEDTADMDRIKAPATPEQREDDHAKVREVIEDQPER